MNIPSISTTFSVLKLDKSNSNKLIESANIISNVFTLSVLKEERSKLCNVSHFLNIRLISKTFIELKFEPKFKLSNAKHSSNIALIFKQLVTSKLLISNDFIFFKPLNNVLIFFTFDVSKWDKSNSSIFSQSANKWSIYSILDVSMFKFILFKLMQPSKKAEIFVVFNKLTFSKFIFSNDSHW